MSIENQAVADNILSTQWLAQLNLVFEHSGEKTVLRRNHHHGPLRVQRPFYPEGPRAHIYILHPPGGMVSGDDLQLSFSASEKAQVLLTTPAAGKVYRARANNQRQRQTVTIDQKRDSSVEWLPQETIIFSGAKVDLETVIELEEGAEIVGWDIVCLARPSRHEKFTAGEVILDLRIHRSGRPLLIERSHIQSATPVLEAPWGLNGSPVVATFYATLACDDENVQQWRQQLAQLKLTGSVALSYRRGVLICRYLGEYAEPGRQYFEHLWTMVRQFRKIQACRPRIWNT